MEPTIVVLILQYGLKYGPGAVRLVRKLLAAKVPTDADWDELEAVLAKDSQGYFEPKRP